MKKAQKSILIALMDIFIYMFCWCFSAMLSKVAFASFLLTEWYYYAIGLCLMLIVNSVSGINSCLLRYIDFYDIIKVILVSLISVAYFVVVVIISETATFEWGVINIILFVPIMCISRYAYKIYASIRNMIKFNSMTQYATRVLIIGAGSAGSLLINEMKTSDKTKVIPVCVLDDDENKIGREIKGVRIVGKVSDVEQVVKQYDIEEIYVTIPSANKKTLKEIYEKCSKTGCKIKTVPGIYQFTDGSVSVSDLKDVSIADLLGREQIKVNIDEIVGYIENKVVVVTGGGGSIGSELCRQIAAHKPKQLIIVDIYENNAYDIEQELIRKYKGKLNLLTLICSVRDSKKMNNVFAKYKPDIVFHAAAHKHVPLMETSPNEAVKNNVCGTFKVADAAGRNGVKRFILISTDKAVNPTNIMGATKRICEMIIQALNKKYDTEYVAVRFGNVLGSNGSVIPLFTKQIAEGGPVTVTHKDIVRYFMTIPEAVSLVLQAGAYAKGGEIFVLDMGEPVKIYDLAVKMIKLSGYEPNRDIDIVITGLRPGEKLYEERLMAEEGLQKTQNNLISIGKPLEFDENKLFDAIHNLYIEAYNETDKMKQLVHELVPTYVVDERK